MHLYMHWSRTVHNGLLTSKRTNIALLYRTSTSIQYINSYHKSLRIPWRTRTRVPPPVWCLAWRRSRGTVRPDGPPGSVPRCSVPDGRSAASYWGPHYRWRCSGSHCPPSPVKSGRFILREVIKLDRLRSTVKAWYKWAGPNLIRKCWLWHHIKITTLEHYENERISNSKSFKGGLRNTKW